MKERRLRSRQAAGSALGSYSPRQGHRHVAWGGGATPCVAPEPQDKVHRDRNPAGVQESEPCTWAEGRLVFEIRLCRGKPPAPLFLGTLPGVPLRSTPGYVPVPLPGRKRIAETAKALTGIVRRPPRHATPIRHCEESPTRRSRLRWTLLAPDGNEIAASLGDSLLANDGKGSLLHMAPPGLSA
jgi:hypothetical protein